jgi:hypothetical protein
LESPESLEKSPTHPIKALLGYTKACGEQAETVDIVGDFRALILVL